MNDQQGFQHELSLKKCEVVSFLASNDEKFESYYFDYGGLGKKTCIWIDHGPHKLPHLLMLRDNFPKFENGVIIFFYEEQE